MMSPYYEIAKQISWLLQTGQLQRPPSNEPTKERTEVTC